MIFHTHIISLRGNRRSEVGFKCFQHFFFASPTSTLKKPRQFADFFQSSLKRFLTFFFFFLHFSELHNTSRAVLSFVFFVFLHLGVLKSMPASDQTHEPYSYSPLFFLTPRRRLVILAAVTEQQDPTFPLSTEISLSRRPTGAYTDASLRTVQGGPRTDFAA